jgi:hypothetical protein
VGPEPELMLSPSIVRREHRSTGASPSPLSRMTSGEERLTHPTVAFMHDNLRTEPLQTGKSLPKLMEHTLS